MHFKIPIKIKTREVWSGDGHREDEGYFVDGADIELTKEQLEFIANIFNKHGEKKIKMTTAKMIRALIIDKLKYRPIGRDHVRLGSMIKRYGVRSMQDAIEEMSTWSFQIEDVINTLEKQAQKKIVPDTNSDISQRIDEITK